MSGYDTQQICRKWGHQITDSYHRSIGKRQKFCHICGSETMIKCDHCNEEIRGDLYVEGVIDLTGQSTPVPSCCRTCGRPYPWKWWFDIKNIGAYCLSPLKYIFDAFVKIISKK